MVSLSSIMLKSVTTFRNPNGPEQEWIKKQARMPANPWKIAVAEVGYICIVPFAIVETALNCIAKTFSYFASITPEEREQINARLESSSFSIAWSFTDVFLNVLCNDLIVTEKVARACAASGKIFSVPVMSDF